MKCSQNSPLPVDFPAGFNQLLILVSQRERTKFILKSHVSVGWNYSVIEGETFLKWFISV